MGLALPCLWRKTRGGANWPVRSPGICGSFALRPRPFPAVSVRPLGCVSLQVPSPASDNATAPGAAGAAQVATQCLPLPMPAAAIAH